MQEFLYTPAKIEAIERAFSIQRLQRYKELAHGDKTQALKLYAWNMALSEAMYGLIQGLEITLRNGIHEKAKGLYGDKWLLTFAHWQPIQCQQIQEAQNNVKRGRNTDVRSEDLIAQLSFGFWVALFAGHYDVTLWRVCLYRLFRETTRRRHVHNILNNLRFLRNRIAHHEPILHLNLASDYANLMGVISALSPDVAEWLRHYNNFSDILQKHPELSPSFPC